MGKPWRRWSQVRSHCACRGSQASHFLSPTPSQCSPPGWAAIVNCSPFRSTQRRNGDGMAQCSNLKLLFTALAKRPSPPKREMDFSHAGTQPESSHGGPGAEKAFRHYRPRGSRKDIGNTGRHLSCRSELRSSFDNGAAGAFVVSHGLHFSRSTVQTEQTLSRQRQLHITLVS